MGLLLILSLLFLPVIVSASSPSSSLAGEWTINEQGRYTGVLIITGTQDAYTGTVTYEGYPSEPVTDISVTGTSVTFTRPNFNARYTGTFKGQNTVSGTATYQGTTYNWDLKKNTVPTTPSNTNDCSQGGYWKLQNKDILRVQEDCAGEFSSNWCATYDWNGGFTDDHGGKVKVTEDDKSSWGREGDYHIEYTAEWAAPPGILVPGRELNMNIDIVASKSGWNDNGWSGLFWQAFFESGPADVLYSWGGRSSDFWLPGVTNSLGPHAGSHTFHWHGDDETTGHTERMGSVKDATKIPVGQPGQEKSIRLLLPSGPVVAYYYSWVSC